MQLLQRRQFSSLSIWFYLVGIFITSVWFMIIWEYRKIDDVQSIIKAEHQIENKPQIDSSNSALLSQTVQDETTNSEKYTEISTVLKENVEPVQKEVVQQDAEPAREDGETVQLDAEPVREDPGSAQVDISAAMGLTESQNSQERLSLPEPGSVGTGNSDGISEDKSDLVVHVPECDQGEFFIPADYSESHCYVAEPEGYEIPFNRTKRLWHIPRQNLGVLNTSEHDYHNQVHNQRWLTMGKKECHLQENGGTSMRNFGTNFNYLDILVNTTQIFSRCRNSSKPVVLDTGAGVGSLAATTIDERAGNRSISTISYVPVDNYLRLGSIISDRGLPVFIHWYTGSNIPVPDKSFDVVHCRWCWHHVVGYDEWLKEMDRIIVPGGAFVFTFVPVEDQELLPLEPWYESLAKMDWDCNRYARIVQVCIKRNPAQETLPCSYKEELEALPSSEILTQIHQAQEVLESRYQTWHPENNDRILNMNCQSYQTCALLETTWNKPTTIHTFSKTESGGDELRRLLHGGSVGLLHTWSKPGPFYPRFFDIVNLMCGANDEISKTAIFESHRLLRPEGFLIVLQSACAKFDDVVALIQEQLFHVVSNQGGVLVAKKISITNSTSVV